MPSSPIAPDQLLTQLHWRYATKAFDPNQTIPAATWHALEQSLVLAPSSFGLQPWTFVVVRNPALRQELLGHANNQRQVVDASHLVVFARKQDLTAADVDPYLQRMAEVRQVPLDSLAGFGGVMKGFLQDPPPGFDVNAWATRQVYIALGMFMTSAALLGVDTCAMEGFVPAEFDRVLGLPDMGCSAVVLCTAGYRHASDKYATLAKVRFPTEAVVRYVD